MAFMGKVKCKKYPKVVLNSMTREQQMQVRKPQEQQGIKPTMRQTSTDARISSLEAKLGITSQPEQGDVKEKEGKTPKEPKWGTGEILPWLTRHRVQSVKNPADSWGHQMGISVKVVLIQKVREKSAPVCEQST